MRGSILVWIAVASDMSDAARKTDETCATPLAHIASPAAWDEKERGQWRAAPPANPTASELYLNLLKTVLTGGINEPLSEPHRDKHGERANGGCEQASENCTMTWDGWARLTALQPVVERVLRENVVGDFAEVRQDHAVPGIHHP